MRGESFGGPIVLIPSSPPNPQPGRGFRNAFLHEVGNLRFGGSADKIERKFGDT